VEGAVVADLCVVPDTDAAGRVAELRSRLAHHPVHRWAVTPGDRATVLAHVAFSHWAGAMLASTLGVPGPARLFNDTCRALRRRGSGACVAAFAAGVAAGVEPSAALVDANGPPAAGPLVELTARLVAYGSSQARAGALALGLPGCPCDEAALAAETTNVGPPAAAPATDAAAAILDAQLTLLDGALHTVRASHMAAHPAMWHRSHGPAGRLRLLPAS
jgi:hypothetical protein